jgi:D-tyrosyl-tRNA(Tyr) deacylase
MRAVIQRVSKASVFVNDNIKGEINTGLLILIGIEEADNHVDIEWLSKKISLLRIFSDDKGLMNKSIIDVDGNILLISQFTLHAKIKKGTRPSFIKAAKPAIAIPIYEQLIKQLCNDISKTIETGEFGADMKVKLINEGPVTITIDTKNKE